MLLEANGQGLPPLSAPDPAVPEKQPLGPLQGVLMSSAAGGVRVWADARGLVSPHLGPSEQVPELHPQPCTSPIGGEEGCKAFGATAALRVGGAPEGGHCLERSDQAGGQGISTPSSESSAMAGCSTSGSSL
jgi:hypothetical protein